jgi:hypothetical protein
MLTAIIVAVAAAAVIFGVLFGLPVILDRYFGGGYAPTRRRRRHRRHHEVLTKDLQPPTTPSKNTGAPRHEPED